MATTPDHAHPAQHDIDTAITVATLPAMTVAATTAFGTHPERAAWRALRAWAGPRGFLDDLAAHPVFGFNQPSPSAAGEPYGYECWIAVPDETKAGDGVTVKRFPGGAYATAECRLIGAPDIGATWRRLVEWVDTHEHQWRETHELERPHDPSVPEEELTFTLYLPIEPPGRA